MTASGEATTNVPVDSSKFDWRSLISTHGTNRSHRSPALSVSLLVRRISSWRYAAASGRFSVYVPASNSALFFRFA